MSEKEILEEILFDEPKIKKIMIKGIKCEIWDDIPYDVASSIADDWMSSAMDQQSGKSKVDLKDTMDNILLSIFVKPKITKEFLKSKKCPSELAGLAVSYYSKLVNGFSILDDAEYIEDYEDVDLDI